MGEILALAEKLWNGEVNTYEYHPYHLPYATEQLGENLWFHKGFSNTIIQKTHDGLIIVDYASAFEKVPKYRAIRGISKDPIHSIIFTHGHADHAFGVEKEKRLATKKGWKHPQVIAHENCINRFERYILTRGWNAHINNAQFMSAGDEGFFPEKWNYPDVTVKDDFTFEVGGVKVELHHARGETDDALWVYFPQSKTLCTGDLFLWGVPNAGNPQKVQRYALEWALSLQEMAKKKVETLIPGHGVPIIGAQRITQALFDTSEYLTILHDKTVKFMNQGWTLEKVLRGVRVPNRLTSKPYLQPIYDEPEFIIRNIWRLYGGWHDGIPSHLKPALEKDIALEISNMVGGVDAIMKRGDELRKQGKHALACHFAQWAHEIAPNDEKVNKIVGEIFLDRAKSETSTMALGIYMAMAKKVLGKNLDALLKHGGSTFELQKQFYLEKDHPTE